MAELRSILGQECPDLVDDDDQADVPDGACVDAPRKHTSVQALLLYTDGGPDHNVKFVTVWFSLILLFLSCDLDLLIAARTCPQQSWRNCVEKIMSILNLALYGVALVRDQLQPT